MQKVLLREKQISETDDGLGQTTCPDYGSDDTTICSRCDAAAASADSDVDPAAFDVLAELAARALVAAGDLCGLFASLESCV